AGGLEAQSDAGGLLHGCMLLHGLLQEGHTCAPSACRCAAIQLIAHASRAKRRSAARHASTVWAFRASMIALVRPTHDATARNAAPRACRLGRPNDTFDAPSVMFSPNSSRISRIVSSVVSTACG